MSRYAPETPHSNCLEDWREGVRVDIVNLRVSRRVRSLWRLGVWRCVLEQERTDVRHARAPVYALVPRFTDAAAPPRGCRGVDVNWR
jgi:hypothetical protein